MVSERFPISYHASPRIHFKLLQIVRGRERAIRGRGNGRVQAEDEVAAEPNFTSECKPKMKLLRNLTWQKLWRSYVKTNKGVVDKLKTKRWQSLKWKSPLIHRLHNQRKIEEFKQLQIMSPYICDSRG
ncbi:hypothetical protein TIFTF001_047890 [Ficus carica]|uniref:Uncharacterized protein n=1 Tax=Ficus carica TaxID=3494 RepID=A0AA87Z2B6_FICCA|nr:hypothetical protein TIFTF001_047890 [Ficus carica]